jgi:D-psicose/D-tagatose/L-ribulose 3-epimerase
MNKIGIYYACWTRNWDADFHPFINRVANLGFDILEVNAGTIANMTSQERLSLKAHAEERGIVLTYCIGLPVQYDVASPDDGVRARGLAYLQKIARAIGQTGGGTVGGILYGCWPATMPTGESNKRPYVERSVVCMREAAKAAEDNNVVFNLEVVNRFEQFILNTSEEAVTYVAEVGSPNVRVMRDTCHMNIEEDFIGGAILKAGDWLGHLHIGENNRMPPGCGHIPWAEIASALHQIGYNGCVVMEPFLVPGGEVGRDIRVFRDLSVGRDLDDEARRALAFVRGVLK